MASSVLCSVPGCDKPHNCKGFCEKHYYRYRKHGSPYGGRTPHGEPKRFVEAVVLPHVDEDCLFWPFARNGHGYGQISHEGKTGPVHRYVCRLVNGEPPSPRHLAAHNCGNGHLGCVNPKHLRWATPKQNTADMVVHGTDMRGSKSYRTSLTEADVLRIRDLQGQMRPGQIGALFGVSRETVNNIHWRRTWAWL